ncbi:MAG: DUF4105 domain-containing protein, partial [Proteobacteria bacterium]|nr:DUF4105 domain-containing protein [Pseudomonadota bacterium]
LRATLTAFFKPLLADSEQEHAQCLFPARFAWLHEQLNFQTEKMPSPECQRYKGWIREIDAGSVTLVFPNYYISAPASMFGHTLLRINASQQDRPALLSYAVNYAALVDHEKTGPLEYGFKGVFGGFMGVFTIAPYYLSANSYNDMELRDIWEYDLNFKPEEIERMMRHLWELKRIYFDYYFFRENCSYHLLSLLEAARPGLRLRNRYTLWTTPVDTLRDVTSQPGLVNRSNYRPSRWSRFRQQMAAMTDLERHLSLSIIRSGNMSFTKKWQELTAESRARILDLLTEYYSLQPSEASGRLREQALAKRAALRTILPPAQYPPISTPPDTGHATTMASLS